MEKRIRQLLMTAGILLLCTGVAFLVYSLRSPSRFGTVSEDLLIQIPVDELPAGALYITEERRQYGPGNMTLIIPAIEVYTPIGDSTLPDGLREMPGLYEFSQLPGEGDVNVSIAGHRDIHDMAFYHLDKLNEGDYLYLLLEGTAYRYRYRDSKVVAPTDWDVIRPQGLSCLTLTTCDPVGTTLRRLVITGVLEDISPFDEGYRFISNGDKAA